MPSGKVFLSTLSNWIQDLYVYFLSIFMILAFFNSLNRLVIGQNNNGFSSLSMHVSWSIQNLQRAQVLNWPCTTVHSSTLLVFIEDLLVTYWIDSRLWYMVYFQVTTSSVSRLLYVRTCMLVWSENEGVIMQK